MNQLHNNATAEQIENFWKAELPTFLAHLEGRNVVALYGAMGVGKTTFTKVLCRELGVEDVVASPTFAIVSEYAVLGKKCPFHRVFHFDCYRLRNTSEALDIGFEDYLDSGELCIIEWPEIIEPLLPEDTLRVYLTEQNDGSRTIEYK